MPSNEKLEERARVLAGEIDKLDALGLPMAAYLVKIAHLDIQMRLHGITDEELDLVHFLTKLEQEFRRSS